MLSAGQIATFVISGDVPSKKNSMGIAVRGNKPHTYKKAILTNYEESFSYQIPNEYKTENKKECQMVCMLYPKDNRKDTINALAIIADCLEQCRVIKNDRQIIDARMLKIAVDKTNPRVKIIIKFLNEGGHNETKKRG